MIFNLFSKGKNAEKETETQPPVIDTPQPVQIAPDRLNDITFIRDMKRFECGGWQQYDILLDAKPYGWTFAVDLADYISHAELKNISTLTVSRSPRGAETELLGAYHKCGSEIKQVYELAQEGSSLGIGGISDILGGPLKIVFFNQTNVLRMFAMTTDEELIKRYTETLVRRTFGTADQMKLGMPRKEDKV